MTQEARCVIIGGGAMGVGLLYYLAHEGWTDTVLLEKGELTSGSTWHAAGLIPNFIGDLNMAKVHEEAVALYPRLEAETGLSAGWHGCGAIRLARTDDEVDWHRYVHAMLTQIGVESHLISPEEIRERHPLLEDLSDVQLGFYTPDDGWTDPSGCTNAMARGARNLGCEIRRHSLVADMSQLPDGRWEIMVAPGGAGPGRSNPDDSYRIVCEHVVNAAGHYAPQLGAMVGLDVPVVSVIHQYLVTEPLQAMIDLGFEPPVTRDPRSSCYYRREIDGLLIGPYEMSGSRTYGIDGIDWDLHFHLTGDDHDVLEECIEYAAMRIPSFAEAGIKQTVSGPITHTPDSGYLMGPAPGLRNYWHCNGASIGITQGPGAGKYLAQWMVHGQTEINVRSMDPPPLRRPHRPPLGLRHRQGPRRVPRDVPGAPARRVPGRGPTPEDHPHPRPPRPAGCPVAGGVRLGAAPVLLARRDRRTALVPPLQRLRPGGRRSAGRAPAGGDRGCHRLRLLRGDRRRRGRPARPPVGQPPARPRRRHPADAHADGPRRHRVRDDRRPPGAGPLLSDLGHHGPKPRPRLAGPARRGWRGRGRGRRHRLHRHPGGDRPPGPGTCWPRSPAPTSATTPSAG